MESQAQYASTHANQPVYVTWSDKPSYLFTYFLLVFSKYVSTYVPPREECWLQHKATHLL